MRFSMRIVHTSGEPFRIVTNGFRASPAEPSSVDPAAPPINTGELTHNGYPVHQRPHIRWLAD
ncbi:hypothetical protein AGR6A_Lc90233 [Agrobacterium sp. NCPPB 925]|nr:hypothetical protein AGR6A_Lc90233 [Agrobacterium sp. NCPPB 925]